MKKVFSEPEVTVIRVEDNNVICTSATPSVTCSVSGSNETSVDIFDF